MVAQRRLAALAAVMASTLYAWSAEPLSPAEQEKLLTKSLELHGESLKLFNAGKPAEAVRLARQALEVDEQLCPPADYPNGHPLLATSLTNLGVLLHATGEYGKALPYFERALAMNERLYPPKDYKEGHPDLATSLNNLGSLLQTMGENGKALLYFEKALAMRKRLYPKGHAELAISLNNLGFLLHAMGENGKALRYHEEALAMRERLYPKGHAELVVSVSNVGFLLHAMGQNGKALPYYEKALAMTERLYPPEVYKYGHPELAISLNNLGGLLSEMGETGKALPYYEKALAMRERLYPPERYKDGHPGLAASLNSLGFLLNELGQYGKALPPLRRGLEMYSRQAARETASAPEAQALAFLRSLPRTRDAYLFACLQVPEEPVPSIYDHVWPTKGALLQLVARRHQAALAAAVESPETRKNWERLQEVRRQLNRLAVNPGKATAVRDRQVAELTDEQEKLERDLAKQIPELERHKHLATLGPDDLVKKLDANTAYIDIVRYVHFGKGKAIDYRYLAFVLAPGRPIHRVDLKEAKPIDDAITSWRGSIDRLEASTAPQKLKELVWDKLAAELPPGTKIVYLCPEGDLARLPWAALPGSKPGTILLEEVAVAVVPSGRWLLEQRVYPQKDATGPDTLVTAGAIDYGKAPDGAKPAYVALAETGREMKRVLEAFSAGDDAGLRLTAATPAALKERLPRAHYAHFATHGYFDEPGLTAERKRIKEQMDKWEFPLDQQTERGGLGAKNPLGYVGLALAGANDPKSAGPDGGILTGLGIVDLNLAKLRLCVLSACETGLGDLTDGEGVVGLQRAFHVAGCPNVVGSLWKVNDAATAAVMAQFYHELRVNKRPPLLALQRAQLTIYRHPDRIPALAGERGRPALDAAAKLGSAATTKPEEKSATAPTKLWAAFVLSGVGMSKEP